MEDKSITDDFQKIKERLQQLLLLAKEQNMSLRGEQLREAFKDMPLDAEQLSALIVSLQKNAIRVESMLPPTEQDQSARIDPDLCARHEQQSGTPVSLTSREEAFVREYLSNLRRSAERENTMLSSWLVRAAELAVSMNCEELPIQDLLSEASVAILTILSENDPDLIGEKQILSMLRTALNDSIQSQVSVKESDQALVQKVAKLEEAVREVNDGEGENFSIAELAVLLDMDAEEIHRILKLTGDE